jgi:hypothetical protein
MPCQPRHQLHYFPGAPAIDCRRMGKAAAVEADGAAKFCRLLKPCVEYFTLLIGRSGADPYRQAPSSL